MITAPPGTISLAGRSDPKVFLVRQGFSSGDGVDAGAGRMARVGPRGAVETSRSSADTDRRGCHARIFFLPSENSRPSTPASSLPLAGRLEIRSRFKGLAGDPSATSPHAAGNCRFVFSVAPGAVQTSRPIESGTGGTRRACLRRIPRSFFEARFARLALQSRGPDRASQCPEHAMHAAGPHRPWRKAPRNSDGGEVGLTRSDNSHEQHEQKRQSGA